MENKKRREMIPNSAPRHPAPGLREHYQKQIFKVVRKELI